MKSFAFVILVLIIWGGIFFYFGRATAPEPTLSQPEPTPEEAIETTAIIETVYVEKPAKIITKQITKTDTVLVNTPSATPSFIEATNEFYFEREGASFGMDITYRYKDRKFRFENMRFKAPKRQIVYRDRLLKFGSAMGLLVDSQGDYKLLLQPINFSLWKFEFYPTVMVDPEYQISYGGLIGLRW